MSRRAAAIFIIVLVAAVGSLFFLTRRPASAPRPRERLTFLRVSPHPAGTPPAGRTTPRETVRVTLLFADGSAGKLRAEERDVEKPSGAGAFLRALFDELARGPTRPGLIGVLPQRIQLRNAFMLPGGEVVLDLAVDSSLSFGSAEELSIVASLVNTVLQNVANSRVVRILVNGEPRESLGGHVDLSRPLGYLHNEVAR